MWIILLGGLAVGGYFTADEISHPAKYPEQTQLNASHSSSHAPAQPPAQDN